MRFLYRNSVVFDNRVDWLELEVIKMMLSSNTTGFCQLSLLGFLGSFSCAGSRLS